MIVPKINPTSRLALLAGVAAFTSIALAACTLVRGPAKDKAKPTTTKAATHNTPTAKEQAAPTPVIKMIEEHQDNTGPFATPQDVTRSCLECHEDVGDDIVTTRHWRWFTEKKQPNGKTVRSGKTNLLNNYCLALDGNWARCTSCHIGYGWKDATFDHTKKENIDCLVCHDQTGTYKKFPTGAGYPAAKEKEFNGKMFTPPDYAEIAKNVGKSSRANCGSCHFNGGGGDGVKHGDLDSSLLTPSRELDVHMGGEGFACADCHDTEKHEISGSLHAGAPMAEKDKQFTCQKCHDEVKHKNPIINEHLSSLACETCHIPLMARGNPTKTDWDWSTAGQDLKPGKGPLGKPLWAKKKGSFKWGKDIVPTYAWSNGTQALHLKGTRVESLEDTLVLAKQLGSIDDPASKIAPFKVMRGKQPIDTEQMMLIVPKLFGPDGFWKTFNWDQSAKLGMEAAGLKYSGALGWVSTEMYWPIHHQIPPNSEALRCGACHGENSRMDWKALGYKGDPKKTGGRKINKQK